ncbi:regulatory protein for glycine cleavage pathway [Salmonella enterica subsp. arizonae]|uniref:Regulatory protein for glycine cleavage pathway n=1 Tax=Salmonella enterica subsp. arizonae TaxID=59203 RepID=A0A379T5S7_SALER|nr:regulatory protein for glycine cleavage pathway [Salmonella enterica subsp. arizonae]
MTARQKLGKIAAFRQWILAKAATEQEKFRFRYEQ